MTSNWRRTSLRRPIACAAILTCTASAVVAAARRSSSNGAPIVEDGNALPAEAATQRAIRADAEVTILGPDRMNIRLFRKGSGKIINVPAD